MWTGLLVLPWWGYLCVALGLTHVTIIAVTVFLHRAGAHRALSLHPLVSHFFRAWLWLTTGMVTKAWVAVHRRHHAACDTVQDPHSPQVLGLRTVLWQGAELYQQAAAQPELLATYGQGTPDDWLERKLYTPHHRWGILLMLLLNVVLFGVLGLTIWAVQMAWIPFFAAGIVNGLGHYWGYRNFHSEDASTNLCPWGIVIGGEELHNNHHAYPASARLSSRWYEWDMGWFYIRLLSLLRLARVQRLAPRVKLGRLKPVCDQETLQALRTYRHEVLATFLRCAWQSCRQEIRLYRPLSAAQVRRYLFSEPSGLSTTAQSQLTTLLNACPRFAQLYALRQRLTQFWTVAPTASGLEELNQWCLSAEKSQLMPLSAFVTRLRRYRL